jgi:alkylation response protein AidB-like acyl-CoA dehydrogenase
MKRSLFLDEHEQFREAVRAFVAREIVPRAERFRAERAIDRKAWLRAGEQGFLGFMVPERFGGGGTNDFRFNAVLAEELARVGYAYASSFGINTDVVSPYLLELTTEKQKDRWLPSFCAGTLVTAIAITEPATGSDVAAIQTTARRDGDSWVVNGSKTFITNGIGSDLVLVVARTGPGERHRGLGVVAVEAGTPGFERGRKLAKLGQHEADTAELFFTDVRVPAGNLIGEAGEGFGYLMRNLAQERLSCAIGAVADAEAVFEETVAYARERRAFGQPIGSFQHNKFELAHMRTEIDVARAWVDRCLEAHVAGELSAPDAAKAKYWATEAQNRVIDACLQVHGGYGYMEEYRVARAWADARVTRIFAGTSEIMREVIGRSLGL